MCPYYLDGDLTELGRARSVIPVATAAYRHAVAVATVQFSRAAERALGRPDRHDGRHGRAPVSQNSTACSASSSADAARRGAPRPLTRTARRRLGRPGPVDVLAARPVAADCDRGDEGHDPPAGAVPCRPLEGAP